MTLTVELNPCPICKGCTALHVDDSQNVLGVRCVETPCRVIFNHSQLSRFDQEESDAQDTVAMYWNSITPKAKRVIKSNHPEGSTKFCPECGSTELVCVRSQRIKLCSNHDAHDKNVEISWPLTEGQVSL